MLPTWTFEREAEHLILQRDEAEGAAYALIVCGPTDTRAYRFTDLPALVTFQNDMEAFLLRTGWLLASFEPERRQQERRSFPRENPDRRRWWTDGLRFRRLVPIRSDENG
jgi:hypothetical protein